MQPSFADRDGLIWFDGELKAMAGLPDTRPHTLCIMASGVSRESVPIKQPRVRLSSVCTIIRRLFDSAKILGMNIPFSMEEIDAAQKAAVASNDLDHAYLRPMVFYGSEGMGLRADSLTTSRDCRRLGVGLVHG